MVGCVSVSPACGQGAAEALAQAQGRDKKGNERTNIFVERNQAPETRERKKGEEKGKQELATRALTNGQGRFAATITSADGC